MQQSPIGWRETKALFFVPERALEPSIASPPLAIGRRRRCFSWRLQGWPSGSGRAAGALRCRAVLGPRTCTACSEPRDPSARPEGNVLEIPSLLVPRCAREARARYRKGAWRQARVGLLCIMCGSALAFFTAAFVCLQNCRRGAASFLRAAWVFSLVLGLGQSEDNRCTSSDAVSCARCLELGPECGWCVQEDFISGGSRSERCDIVSNLISKGCSVDSIEYPSVRVIIPSENEINTQVTPGEVSIQLRPGAEANFMLKIHPLKKYPVDLYYLVDVSASMHNNIEKLNSVGNDLSRKMAFFSRDFRLGFGSYVDKTVSPYISVHPERIHNQCSDYNLDCMPPHGYIHVLSLTENITEFEKAVHRQKISGNIDTPEGGFDAMLQAAVCESHIGWRKEAKRLLLVMTDQTSHLALDSKLAGIVVPNDGNCHLKNNVYVKSTTMEHPSLGQLSEKLIDNNINVIFAVQGKQFHWYKDLLPLLPGTIAGEIESKAANLNNLVVEAYKVLFNVTVTMKKCDVTGGKNYAKIKPIGFNETTKIHIHRRCSCQCEDHRGPKGKCEDETFLDSKCLQCDESKCHFDEDAFPSESCRLHKDQPVCSGRGVCICGKCVCHKIKLGKVYGKYCEKDDFSCPYHHGNLCAGHGECEAGRCQCFSGWEGDRCQCPSASSQHCVNSKGQVCSGRGTCVCGRCECTDPRSIGRFCEHCPTCHTACSENCSSRRNCMQCLHPHNLSQAILDQCKTSCALMDQHYGHQTSECLSSPSYLRIFFIIFIVTFLIGLLKVLIIRQAILQWNSNKIKSSSDYRVSASKKDKLLLQSVCTRTVTYRREKPEEIKLDISKLNAHENFRCNF
ncbi:integrin beta-8 isoform X3 [Ictidomys tridecemlineatus]|uniref:integrin beta-8 isoform X3 n=1 Tax=Ictidomys tridecemlineatus TaxID=43179 RepID=UPI001A9D7FF1|nr:integrin beta-8 isoform X3 [Ictidomys tridecemlineatus]